MASTWLSTHTPKIFPKLEENIEVDVLIIGGGIAGSTAAYLLAKEGKNAVLIDKGTLSESTTAYTTAFLTNVVDTELSELVKMFGEAKAKRIWQSHAKAIDAIETIVNDEKIECEFMRCPNFLYANDEKEWKLITREAEFAEKFGFKVERMRDKYLPLKNSGSLHIRDQAKFHPLKFVETLREKAIQNGARIFEKTEAKRLSCGENETGCVETADGHMIWAEKVFVATHLPFNKPKELFAHKGVYTTYIMELSIPSRILPEGIYEDANNPYHYFRVDRDKLGLRDRMLVGGEDHRRELPLNEEKAYVALEEYVGEILPDLEYSIIEKWSGPIVETLDGLAFIGEYDKKNAGIFVATGFSGTGMTYGTLSAKMFSEFAAGYEIPYKDLYDPLRKTGMSKLLRKGRDYTEELVGGYGKNIFKAVHKNKKNDLNNKKSE